MCMRWLNECWAPAVAETERVLGSNELEQLLFVDGLSGQVNAAFIKTARTYDTLVHIGPAGTTDLTQPIDRGIGNMLKQRFKSKIDDWLASDAECVRRWTSAPGKGGLSASELRVMTTRLAADAWDEVKAASATIVKCAEQSGALIGVGGVGIEKFKLPQRGAGLDDAPLAVDWNDVGDKFADRSDDEENDDDDADDDNDVGAATPPTLRANNKNNDDDDDNDDVHDADDESSDDDELSDGETDDEAIDPDVNRLLAPHGYALVSLPTDKAFILDATLRQGRVQGAAHVGKEIVVRFGERSAPRSATIVRQATVRDRATDSKINFAIKYKDDGSVAPIWLRNRDYGIDWAFIEKTMLQTPLATHRASEATLQAATDDPDAATNATAAAASAAASAAVMAAATAAAASAAAAAASAGRAERAAARMARRPTATIYKYTVNANNVGNVGNNNRATTITPISTCTHLCDCIGVTSCSTSPLCNCRRCHADCGCRKSNSSCKNDDVARDEPPAKRARQNN